MKHLAILLLLCLVVFEAFHEGAFSQTLAQQNLDSLAKSLNIRLSGLTSPALEERKLIRQKMQRSCYANVLSDVLLQDGLSAIISFIKVKLQIEYSISHRPLGLFIRQSDGRVWPVVLSDDWTFPDDPWKKE